MASVFSMMSSSEKFDKQRNMIGFQLCRLLSKLYSVCQDRIIRLYLSKGYRNPKRKLGVTTHFLQMIKQQ